MWGIHWIHCGLFLADCFRTVVEQHLIRRDFLQLALWHGHLQVAIACLTRIVSDALRLYGGYDQVSLLIEEPCIDRIKPLLFAAVHEISIHSYFAPAGKTSIVPIYLGVAGDHTSLEPHSFGTVFRRNS